MVSPSAGSANSANSLREGVEKYVEPLVPLLVIDMPHRMTKLVSGGGSASATRSPARAAACSGVIGPTGGSMNEPPSLGSRSVGSEASCAQHCLKHFQAHTLRARSVLSAAYVTI
jgi:hypothetical protein